jgi:hypothetical protein
MTLISIFKVLMNLEEFNIIKVPVSAIESKIKSRFDMYQMLTQSCKYVLHKVNSISPLSQIAQ